MNVPINHERWTELTVPAPREFSFAQNWAYLSRSPNECMHHISEGAVSKRIQIGAERAIIVVRDGGEAGLSVRVRTNEAAGERTLGSLLDGVQAYVRDWFDLDTDLAPFYEAAERDPLLRLVTGRFYGLRTMGIPDLFEALCWGIIGQQINLAFAYTLKRRFVEAFGEQERLDGKSYSLFPTPEAIARLSPSDLTSLQITGRKSEYLIGTAGLIAEGKLSKEMLLEAGGHREAEKLLVGIRGIGPWTANYVLMRCLRFKESLPIEDVGLHNAIKALLGMDRKPTLAEIREMAKPWAGWESYATFYLWRALY